MPTPDGRETKGEKLTRLRAALTRVRNTIARVEDNGQATDISGTSITELSYDRALKREKELLAEIADLEADIAGTPRAPRGIAHTVTRIE